MKPMNPEKLKNFCPWSILDWASPEDWEEATRLFRPSTRPTALLRLIFGFVLAASLFYLFTGCAHAGQVPDPSTLNDRTLCLTAY